MAYVDQDFQNGYILSINSAFSSSPRDVSNLVFIKYTETDLYPYVYFLKKQLDKKINKCFLVTDIIRFKSKSLFKNYFQSSVTFNKVHNILHYTTFSFRTFLIKRILRVFTKSMIASYALMFFHKQ